MNKTTISKTLFGFGLFTYCLQPLLGHESSSSSDSNSTYDYIIVGNGTAGAVLARKLSDNKKHSVLVIEAGQNLSKDPAVLTPNFISVIPEITFNPKYAETYPVFIPEGFVQTTTYSEGRMWGGSSAHNYTVCVHGTPNLYNSWAMESANSRWSYNNLLPIIKSIETYTPNGTTANPLERGSNGPIYVTQLPPVNGNFYAQQFSNATSAPLVSDYNDPSLGNTSVSALQQFLTPPPNSHRSFSINGYLPDSVVTADGKGRQGRKLTIISEATVARVLFSGKKAKGVEFVSTKNGLKVQKAFAKKKIILSAGAIHTPAILQRSGIGDSTFLRAKNIPVVFHNENVGKNLVNQYGPLFVTTGNNPDFIDALYDGSPYFPNDGIRRFQTNMFNGSPILGYGFILNPKSRGSVEIVNQDPFTSPKLDLNMYSDGPVSDFGSDAYASVAVLKIAKDFATNAGEIVLAPSPDIYAAGDDALLTYAKSNPNALISDHISGTCRMSTSANSGVVDGNLQVFGVKHLMVCDLSVAPVSPDGNPCFAVYVLANEAARILQAS